MKIRRFTGKDMRDALRLVKEELGADAVIMSNKKTVNGIELVAAYDKEPHGEKLLSPQRAMTGGNNAETYTPQKIKPSATLSEIIGDSGQDSLRALLEKQQQAEQSLDNSYFPAQQAQDMEPHQASKLAFNSPESTRFTPEPAREARTNPAPVNTPDNSQHAESMAEIKAELHSLRNVLTHQVAGLIHQDRQRQNPIKHYLGQELQEMGINAGLAEQMLSFAPDSSDERQAWLFVLKLMANRLNIAGQNIVSQGGVVALVGPTGTGKTTTVAKLAAQFAKQHGADSVAMVTIDTYRIAAFEQLATYGKIIGCQVKKAQNSEELADSLYQLRNKKLILIDSAGFSQRDIRLIQQLSTFENVTNMPINKYLVAQASAQYQVLQRTIDAYRNVQLTGCIFTKLDECYSLGEMISVAIENELPISYLTDGQKVPEDIQLAKAQQIIADAAKLYKQYAKQSAKGMHSVQSARAI
jgi:flagellar biosynthesis protein FlhF